MSKDRFFYQFIKTCIISGEGKSAIDKLENIGIKLKRKYLEACLNRKDFIHFSDNMRIFEYYVKKNHRSFDEISDDGISVAFLMIVPDMILFASKFIDNLDIESDKEAEKILMSIMKPMIKKGLKQGSF